MKITDSVTLGDARVNDAGYLEANARTARIGVQQYLGAEIGRDDLAIVNVYRDANEVFARRSLDTFSKIPVTTDHPPEPVTAANWRDYAVGTTGDEVLRDGEYLKIGLKITDAAAVEAIKAGKRELSVGYNTDLIWEDGKAPDGTPYHARQTAITANHIAIVARGRAGSQVRIGDGAAPWGVSPIIDHHPIKDRIMTLKTVTVDGIPIEVTDQGATVIATMQKRLGDSEAKLADAEKTHADAVKAKDAEIAKRDEEIGTLKADLKKAQDAAPKPEDLDKLVQDRATLVTTVKAIDAKIDPKGKSDADLRKAAVAAKLGDDMVKDASEAEVSGMFRAIAKDVKVADPFASALKDGVHATSFNDNGQAAYEKRLGDAWKHQQKEA